MSGMMHRVVHAVIKRIPPHAKARAEELVFGLRGFERLSMPATSALTVICDDGESKDLAIVEVLNRIGVKGVFAVSPDLIGRQGFLGYPQLRQIRDAGHEIAFHGTTHDPFTSFRDKSRLQAVSRDGIARFEAEGFRGPTTLVYPYGAHDRGVRLSMGPLFRCAFTTWFGFNQGRANRYALRRIPLGAYTGKLPADEKWYRSIIEHAARGNCWPSLMLHPAAEGHRDDHNGLLFRVVKHALDLGMPVRTASAHIDTCETRTAVVDGQAAQIRSR